MRPGWELYFPRSNFLSNGVPSPLLCSVFTRERSDFEGKWVVLTSFLVKNGMTSFLGVGWVWVWSDTSIPSSRLGEW